MGDYGSFQSSKAIKYKHLSSSIFTSPRLLICDEIDSTMNSPTSILDSKPFSALKNETTTPKKHQCKNLWDSMAVGLGLVDALIDDKPYPDSSKPGTRMVVFGSQLKIQVPPLPPSLLSPDESPNSPSDFGIKTRNSCCSPPSPVKKSPFGSMNSGLSATEMELSEDYTCVISYGPNPRTTHIFDDCVVESCCGGVKFSESRKVNIEFSTRSMSYPSQSFLRFCYNCKKNLGQGKDIYMYRGEKAFCSSDCRYAEMMLEEERGTEASDSDDVYVLPIKCNFNPNLALPKPSNFQFSPPVTVARRNRRRFRRCPSPSQSSQPLRRDPDSDSSIDSRYRKGDVSSTDVDEDLAVSNKTALLKKKYSINTLKCFGVELTPDTIAVAMVYFVQGVLGLSRIAVNFYMKDDLHLDPAEFGISDEWFAVGDSLVLTVLGQISFIPVLVLAAKIFPEGMEATLFATLMSISNAGSVLGGLIGAGLTQLFGVRKDRFDNLTYLIVLCNLTSLLPLPLLGLLPDDIADADSNENSDIEFKSN